MLSKKILDQSYTDTNAITSSVASGGGHTKVVLFVYATTAGTLQPRYTDEDGAARNLPGGTYAISADSLAVVFFDHPVPRIDVVFTPSAQPGNVQVDAHQM